MEFLYAEERPAAVVREIELKPEGRTTGLKRKSSKRSPATAQAVEEPSSSGAQASSSKRSKKEKKAKEDAQLPEQEAQPTPPTAAANLAVAAVALARAQPTKRKGKSTNTDDERDAVALTGSMRGPRPEHSVEDAPASKLTIGHVTISSERAKGKASETKEERRARKEEKRRLKEARRVAEQAVVAQTDSHPPTQLGTTSDVRSSAQRTKPRKADKPLAAPPAPKLADYLPLVPKKSKKTEPKVDLPSTPAARSGRANIHARAAKVRGRPAAHDLSSHEFIARMQDEEARNEYLATNWTDAATLQKLEADGVLTYKRGRFTEGDKGALRAHFETFRRTHNLTESQMIDLMFENRRKGKDRGAYPTFWTDAAAVVPGRPVRYVKDAVQRMYNPNGHQGRWSAEEDAALLAAYERAPGSWTVIAESVGRSLLDVRDRYEKQLKPAEGRAHGKWSDEELEALKTAVFKVMRELGLDPLTGEVPWPTVSKVMEGNRTPWQCRLKWELIRPSLRGNEATPDPVQLVKLVRQQGYKHERDIIWPEVAKVHGWSGRKASDAWLMLRGRALRRHPEALRFFDLLDVIEKGVDDGSLLKGMKRKRSDVGVEGESELDEPVKEKKQAKTAKKAKKVKQEENGGQSLQKLSSKPAKPRTGRERTIDASRIKSKEMVSDSD